MGKLTFILTAATAMLIAGILVGKTEAMPVGDMAKSHNVVEKAACFGWGPFCRPGRHWVCGPRHCWCARC